MRSRNIYILIILIFLAFVSVRSCRKAASWLMEDDLPPRADAIVLLMGSLPDRVLQTADLYEQDIVKHVIIVEPAIGAGKALEARGVPVIRESTQVCSALLALGVPEEALIVLPGDASSTQMEAIIVRDYTSNRTDLDSLIIVSSLFHTKRASMIFRTAFKKSPEPVYIFSSPSSYTELDPDKWWKNREAVQRVLMEYIKLASFICFEKGALK
jgi:uncharacterized SAM-binding protein YcdF (DUF218 family)